MNEDPAAASRSRVPALWVRLVALWILVGAGFKLFWGTPADLPKLLHELPLELGLVYKLAITIELSIALTALLRPRWGWCLETLQLLVFDAVLVHQIAGGEANCGCFGAKVHVSPWVMLGVDSVLLVGLFALRPWSRLARGGVHRLVPLAAVALAVALPWIFDREARGDASGAGSGDAFVVLEVEKWIGHEIWDTPLGKPPLSQYIDVNQMPLDGLWVLYRASCDHCAAYLKHLAEVEHGERLIALVQLEEKTDTLANQAVHEMPDGNFVQHARLPAAFVYVIQTPGELVLEGGKVVAAREGASAEEAPVPPPDPR